MTTVKLDRIARLSWHTWLGVLSLALGAAIIVTTGFTPVGFLLAALEDGPARFGVLKTRLDGISPKVLSAVLRRLETHELISRTVYPEVPLHVEYALTPLGRDACVPIGAMLFWIQDNIERYPNVTA